MQKDEIRERLVELLDTIIDGGFKWHSHLYESGEQLNNDEIASYLIAHGVTFATDTNVGSKWISVEERIPDIYDKDPNWSQTVLFRTVYGHIHSGYRNIGRAQTSFYDDDWTPPYWLDESEDLSFEENEVTHWMPIP